MTTTTFIEYDGDGSDLTFDYSFPTYKQAEVKVAVSGVIVDNWTITGGWAASGTKEVKFDNTTGTTNATVCESSGAPKAGTKNVRIFRDTDIDAAKHTFNAGSSIKAAELNTNHEQLRRALQEEQYNTKHTYDIKDGAITSAKLDTNIAIDGTLSTGGLADLQTLTVDTTAAITGNTTVGGTLIVTGVSTHNNNLNVGGVLDVTGSTVLTGSLDANGGASIDNVQIGVTDNNEIDTASGNLTIDSAGGTVTVDDNLTVTGTTTAAAINASGAVNATGNLAINSNKFNINATSGDTTIAGTLGVTGQITGNLTGNVTGNVSGTAGSVSGNAATATEATNVTASANNSTNETTYLTFVDGATGTQGIETDTGLTYNPSTGVLTTTQVTGNVTGNVTGSSGSCTGNAATATTISGVDASATELNKLDGFTGSTADLNEVVTGKAVVESISASSTNAQIPTALAVDTRITSLITDVGGFRPIANETSFPATNPDPEDDAGTIVSIKALSQAFTTGSGVTTKVFTDGAGSGNDVTITGLTQSTTYPQGRGMLVETTSTLHTYAFHRLTLDETGVAAAQAAIDDWDERYYGPVGSEPSTRPGGGSRVQGDLYFDTGDNQMKVWNNTASQWDDVASSASSNIVTFSPAFDSNETEFTASTVPVDAQSILISINGVIQKPNTGTSTPSEGYIKMANGKIKFATAPDTDSDYFAVSLGNTVSIGTPSPNTVGANELKDDEITEVKLDIHNSPSGTDKFLAYTSNGMEWAVPAGVSLANDANDRVVTGTGSGLNGEEYLTFNGTGDLRVIGNENTAANLFLVSDQSDNTGDEWRLSSQVDNYFQIANDNSGSFIAHVSLSKIGDSTHFGTGGNQHTFRSDSYCIVNIDADSDNNETNTDSILRFQTNSSTTAEIRYDESLDLLEICHGSDNQHLSINSNGQVVIGTTTEGNASADNLTVADSATCGITIRSGEANTGNIYFSDAVSGTGEYAGAIEYKHGSTDDDDSLRFHTSSGEKVRIDKNGHVGIGTDDPANFANYKNLELSGTTGGAITFSDDEVQKWEIYGEDNDLSFYNRTNTEYRLRLYKAGNVAITNGDLVLAQGHGINFSAQSATSATGATTGDEVLNHYEEGTFTPILNFGGVGVPAYNNSTNGTYTRIGRVVHFRAYIMLSDKGSNTGTALMYGLPFSNNSGSRYAAVSTWCTNMELGAPHTLLAYVENNTTYVTLHRYNNTSGDASAVTGSQFNDNSEFMVAGTYFT